jgi:hypothetical protein
MTWQYGEYVGNRNRANNCAATGQLFQACNKTVMAGPGVNQTRSCSNDESATQPDNCASEICSVYTGGVNHQNVRLRLDCYDPMDQQEPNTQEWLDTWDTCVAVCFLPP